MQTSQEPATKRAKTEEDATNGATAAVAPVASVREPMIDANERGERVPEEKEEKATATIGQSGNLQPIQIRTIVMWQLTVAHCSNPEKCGETDHEVGARCQAGASRGGGPGRKSNGHLLSTTHAIVKSSRPFFVPPGKLNFCLLG